MSIAVTTQSQYDFANLTAVESSSLISAISTIVTLPSGVNWDQVKTINILINNDFTGSISIQNVVS